MARTGTKCLYATSAIDVSVISMFYKITRGHTPAKSLLNARSVTSDLPATTISRHTWGYTQVRNPIIVLTVKGSSYKLPTSEDIYGCIQVSDHMHAICAVRVFLIAISSKHTFSSMRILNHLSVKNVKVALDGGTTLCTISALKMKQTSENPGAGAAQRRTMNFQRCCRQYFRSVCPHLFQIYLLLQLLLWQSAWHQSLLNEIHLLRSSHNLHICSRQGEATIHSTILCWVSAVRMVMADSTTVCKQDLSTWQFPPLQHLCPLLFPGFRRQLTTTPAITVLWKER